MAIWREARRAAVIATIVALSLPASAQVPPAAAADSKQAAQQAVHDGGTPKFIREETPQQRKDRLGTIEDPGLDPDPTKVYWRFGKSYKIERYDRRSAAYDQPEGWVRPLAMIN